jgi:hypothetical protein
MGRAWSTHEREEECIQGLAGRREGNRSLGRHTRRWEDNIKIDLRKLEWRL